LNVHQGSMNRLALTSKPPVTVFLEISRIASILGLHTTVSGYKLECVRPSIDDEEENETMYGREFHDDWQELIFSIEICRFENLSGLFCIDMQHLSGDDRAYRFLGEKI
ncbi:hypothetical protein K501DRAFT_136347, partial [Backusella circina FSU 941]